MCARSTRRPLERVWEPASMEMPRSLPVCFSCVIQLLATDAKSYVFPRNSNAEFASLLVPVTLYIQVKSLKHVRNSSRSGISQSAVSSHGEPVRAGGRTRRYNWLMAGNCLIRHDLNSASRDVVVDRVSFRALSVAGNPKISV